MYTIDQVKGVRRVFLLENTAPPHYTSGRFYVKREVAFCYKLELYLALTIPFFSFVSYTYCGLPLIIRHIAGLNIK